MGIIVKVGWKLEVIRTQREEYRDVIDVKGRHLLGCRGTRWYRVRESVYERVKLAACSP